MNETEKRIAIAEACGWQDVFICDDGKVFGLPPGFTEDQCPEGADEEVPDYLHDLNAMHEAEETLYHKEDYGHAASVYFCWLLVVTKECCDYAEARCEPVVNVNHNEIVSATAAQRAEAFLRTVGKWKE